MYVISMLVDRTVHVCRIGVMAVLFFFSIELLKMIAKVCLHWPAVV